MTSLPGRGKSRDSLPKRATGKGQNGRFWPEKAKIGPFWPLPVAAFDDFDRFRRSKSSKMVKSSRTATGKGQNTLTRPPTGVSSAVIRRSSSSLQPPAGRATRFKRVARPAGLCNARQVTHYEKSRFSSKIAILTIFSL
mgnify:CR=1 FL=1